MFSWKLDDSAVAAIHDAPRESPRQPRRACAAVVGWPERIGIAIVRQEHARIARARRAMRHEDVIHHLAVAVRFHPGPAAGRPVPDGRSHRDHRLPLGQRPARRCPGMVGAIQSFGLLIYWHPHIHGLFSEQMFSAELPALSLTFVDSRLLASSAVPECGQRQRRTTKARGCGGAATRGRGQEEEATRGFGYCASELPRSRSASRWGPRSTRTR